MNVEGHTDVKLDALSADLRAAVAAAVLRTFGVALDFTGGLVSWSLDAAVLRKPMAHVSLYGAFRIAARMMDRKMKREQPGRAYRWE